ncbi:MAG: succinate dehydrogenase, hydrophobic membrane anchor protein [Rhodobacteraceae bacterium]|nr:succinate dehydrogenase, hydrophobic membrane anchor protein [Paracoccaceae bacterium]
MSYQTDRQRVEGLGSAKDGTHEWWGQRISAIALIPLVILFVLPFAHYLGADYDVIRRVYAHPFNAIVAILFFITITFHLRHGLQEVIVDYVHNKRTMTLALLLNTMFTTVLGVTGIFAVAKIAFAG